MKLLVFCLVAVATTMQAQDTATAHASGRRYEAKGDVALAAGQRDTARVAYEAAVSADHDNIDATVKLARLLVEDGKAGYAKNLLQRSLSLHPTDPRLLTFRAVRKSSVDTAAARYDSLLGRDDAGEDVYRAAASEAVATGFYPRAEGLLSRALAMWPKSTSLRALADTLQTVRKPQ